MTDASKVRGRGGSSFKVALWLPCVLIAFACSEGGGTSDADDGRGGKGSSWYFSADAASGGDGSEELPFDALAQAEEASAPGDVIYVLPAESETPLDGGIALKDTVYVV